MQAASQIASTLISAGSILKILDLDSVAADIFRAASRAPFFYAGLKKNPRRQTYTK
jgi:hypothetical protein